MATTMTTAQRTHADKTLADLEQTLTSVLTSDVAPADRDHLTAELADIRSQRQALSNAHPNDAYRWTKAAAARTKKLHRKHRQALTADQNTTSSPKVQRSSRCTSPTAPRDTGDHSPTPAFEHHDTPQLELPHTAEHRDLLVKTTRLLLQRRTRLRRSARVTTGRLHTAILTELRRVDDDLRTLPRISHRKTTACHDHHQHAEEQWNTHGAEVLTRRPCLR
ncbi:MAG: hypothetical protein ACTHZD_15995 [Micrococcaceae bacterium]